MANCSPAAILDFSASINPLGPPASAIAAIGHSLEDLTSYPDPGYTHLRSAIGRFHQISPDWILPGNGAAELLTWACRDLARQDVVHLLTPAFGDYFRALRAFGAKVEKFSPEIVEDESETYEDVAVFIPEEAPHPKEFPLGFEELDCRLDRLHFNDPEIAIGLLLNNPHNPTGALLSQETVLHYLKQVALLVVDEAFMDFLPPGEQQSVIHWVQEYPNLVVVRSLTKFYSLPGLRLGYAIAHPDRLKRWQQWRDPWSVNTLAAAVSEVLLQDTQFQQQTWDWLAAARSQLFQGLKSLPGLQPCSSAANFLLVRSHQSVTQIQTRLLKRHRILIRDCLSYPELGDRYFRVAVRTDAENERLLAGLADVLSRE